MSLGRTSWKSRSYVSDQLTTWLRSDRRRASCGLQMVVHAARNAEHFQRALGVPPGPRLRLLHDRDHLSFRLRRRSGELLQPQIFFFISRFSAVNGTLGYERTTPIPVPQNQSPNWTSRPLPGFRAIELSKEGLELSAEAGVLIGAGASASTGPIGCTILP